jgi:DNA-directed RNA polymerase subunit RPC12/RpoP
MIKFKCSQCGKEISAADEHAGRKAKCPGCQAILQIPGGRPAPPPPPKPVVPEVEEVAEAVEEAPPRPRKPAVPAVNVKAGKPRRDPDEEDVEEVDEVPAEDEDDEEEDDRPRKKRRKGRKRGRWHGEWADCPNCGAPGDATRLTYTFWGGFIGPMIINVVRCNQCGTTYNGKHGDYNTTRIIIYYAVSIAIALVILGGCGIIGALNNH